MITEYKDLLPFCGTVWCYDWFKAHITEWEALTFYMCVWTPYCPSLCSYQILLALVVPQRHVTKKYECVPLTFRCLLSLVVLIWKYIQITVFGFEFTSLQVNAHANVMELPKDDARVERKPPTESGSLKLTEKVKKVCLLIDDQLLECLLLSGLWPIFHTRISFTKIINC